MRLSALSRKFGVLSHSGLCPPWPWPRCLPLSYSRENTSFSVSTLRDPSLRVWGALRVHAQAQWAACRDMPQMASLRGQTVTGRGWWWLGGGNSLWVPGGGVSAAPVLARLDSKEPGCRDARCQPGQLVLPRSHKMANWINKDVPPAGAPRGTPDGPACPPLQVGPHSQLPRRKVLAVSQEGYTGARWPGQGPRRTRRPSQGACASASQGALEFCPSNLIRKSRHSLGRGWPWNSMFHHPGAPGSCHEHAVKAHTRLVSFHNDGFIQSPNKADAIIEQVLGSKLRDISPRD